MTAFEILQRLDELPSVAYEPDSAAVVKHCGMSNASRAQAFLKSFYIAAKKPMHLLTANQSLSGDFKNVKRHVVSASLPPRAVFQLESGVYCTSPEETYLSLAASLVEEAAKDLSFKAEAILAQHGMELCGLYCHDAKTGNLTERKAALTTRAKLSAYLDKCGYRPGIRLARKALAHVEDRMRSPMEVTCALLLCRTQRIGSMGFPLGEPNCAIETSEGIREVDRLWKKAGLGYEYQGREYHTAETRRQEDRRRNALLGSGITIMNIWYEDLAQPHAFNELCKTLAKMMGKRLRTRNKDFEWKQHVLRSVVLPSLNRFG